MVAYRDGLQKRIYLILLLCEKYDMNSPCDWFLFCPLWVLNLISFHGMQNIFKIILCELLHKPVLMYFKQLTWQNIFSISWLLVKNKLSSSFCFFISVSHISLNSKHLECARLWQVIWIVSNIWTIYILYTANKYICCTKCVSAWSFKIKKLKETIY